MKSSVGLVFYLLLVVAPAAIYHKLSSLGPNTLTSTDYIASTLGNFRLTLKPITCQLQIQTFNNYNYIIVGYFPRIALNSCGSLLIRSNSLVSNNNQTILALKNSQLGVRFDQVMVTVDQTAIIRISGLFLNQWQTSQNWISIFRSPQQYTYAISNLSVTNYHSLSFIQNSGSWGFSATNGVLRIFRIENSTKIKRHNYSAFTMTPNNLFDYNSNALPAADFKGYQYQAKCVNTNNMALQGPFTFTINPYFPELRVLDQTGYEIVAVRYPEVDCNYMVGVDQLEGSTRCISWFCPQNMFEHQGSCVTSCPAPYFHQIGQNNIHRCVLLCREDYQKDNILRICSCSAPVLYSCPSNLKATALGCLCSSGTYFNPSNQPINSADVCLDSCGPKMYPHRDGVCLPCPLFCLSCTLSGNSFNYLKCIQCQSSYLLNSEGYCTKDCRASIGKLYLNGRCESCRVKDCANCSKGIDRCSACMKPYALMGDSCVIYCPAGFRAIIRKDDSFQCVKNADCPAIFTPANISINNQSHCLCIFSKKYTFISQCGSTSPPCPFDHYFDSSTFQCLRCPLGCLTCTLDASSKVQCTSCRPDYNLIITLRKNHYCQRRSILSFCSSNYSQIRQMCQVNNMVSMAGILPYRNLCLSVVNNCMVCVTDNRSECSICQEGYYLSKGACLSQCPQNSTAYPYQPVCIERTIVNCIKQVTERAYWPFTKDTLNQNADVLMYLLTVNFQMTDSLNDPIGSVFLYASRSPTLLEGRSVNIAHSRQKCQLCATGYGLTFQGQCSLCISPCLQCIYADAKACIKCDSFHRILNGSCVKLNPTEMPCTDSQFRNESYMCQKQCLQFYRTDYQVNLSNSSFPVNCTFNCPSDHQIIQIGTSTGQNLLKCEVGGATEKEWVHFFGSRVKAPSSVIYLLIASKKLILSGSKLGTVRNLASTIRFLQKSENVTGQLKSTDFGFVYLDSNSQFNQEGIVFELNPSNIHSQGPTYLGNSQYVIHNQTTAPIDLLLNQAGGLYGYGRAMVILLLIATVIFMGQQLAYKTDNIFITFQVLYLILPSLNLIPSSSAFACYSFLYGFSWSSYLELFSDPRSLTASTSWFDGYLQQVNNNSHYALYVDSNLLRNCWSVFLFLFIAVPLCLLLILIFKCFSSGKNSFSNGISRQLGRQETDFDHSQQLKCMLIFFFQNSFISLAYYSLLQMLSPQWQLASSSTQLIYKILAIMLVSLMAAYTLLRWYTNSIGGIYCIKKIMLGFALGLMSVAGGVDQNIPLSMFLLVGIEAGFLCLRYRYEMLTHSLSLLCCKQPKVQLIKEVLKQPPKSNKITHRYTLPQHIHIHPQNLSESNSGKPAEQAIPQNTQKQKFIYLILQEMLIIVIYIVAVLMSLGNQGTIVVAWLGVLILMVSSGIDLFDMVSIYKEKFGTRKEVSKPYIKKIRTLWDHDLSLKSLAETNTD